LSRDSHFAVLVVDDDPDTVESTAAVLSIHGFRVLTAADGEAALRAATDLPDVVLADLMMPGIDGCELARRLRNGSGARPPVLIAVTGCVTESDRRRTTAAGFDLHMAKPVAPAVLVGLLRRLRDSLTERAELAGESPA
jgi:CheY-like chemotaxis protein